MNGKPESLTMEINTMIIKFYPESLMCWRVLPQGLFSTGWKGRLASIGEMLKLSSQSRVLWWAFNTSSLEANLGCNSKFQASQGNLARPCLKTEQCARGVAPLAKCLSSMHDDPGFDPQNSINLALEVEAGPSEVQGYAWLPREFETSLGCLRPASKIKAGLERWLRG